jgi:prephenate dehydrogenase
MARDKHKNRSNRNQGCLASSEHNSRNIASPGYTMAPEKQDMDLKSFLMMLMEDSKDINNSPKEIQENTSKLLEALKEETEKSLKELQENTSKQVKELKKTSRI